MESDTEINVKGGSSWQKQKQGCKGKRCCVPFIPLAWTPICAQQMQDLEKGGKAIEKPNPIKQLPDLAEILAVLKA